jgi:rhodanese-related sulfurtransferase
MMEERSFDDRVADAKTRVREMTPEEVLEMRRRGDDVVYLDVREPNEWNLFRIPGAVHVPLARVRDHVGKTIALERRVIVYCARGGRAVLAADTMRELGYADVASIAGGVMAWVNAGGELEE